MKILKQSCNQDDVFGMANLVPKNTGLKTDLWVDHKGVQHKVSHYNIPRLKVGPRDNRIPVLIDEHPKTLIDEKTIDQKLLKDVKSTFPYISRNQDLFKRHYFDVTDDFGDRDLENALIKRKDFKL